MTDFTPGRIITRDNPLCDVWPPSWLRNGTQYQHVSDIYCYDWSLWDTGARSVDFDAKESPCDWHAIDAIRLDASDIVYRCIAWNEAHPDEPLMWPWYGGDEAPADFVGGGSDTVLYRDGRNERRWVNAWDHRGQNWDIIGYQRRPTTSLPEPAEEKWAPHLDYAGEPMKVGQFREPLEDTQLRASVAAAVDREIRSKHGIDPEVPAYSAVETAKHYAELAGMVAVTPKTRRDWMDWQQDQQIPWAPWAILGELGLLLPDPTPRGYREGRGPVSFWTSTLHTRRRPHHCASCGQLVQVGEPSWNERGLYDGDFNSYKQCRACHDIVRYFFWSGRFWDDGFMLCELADMARDEGLIWPPVWDYVAPLSTHQEQSNG